MMFSYSSSFYRSLPKVELHRHMEGSLRLATLQDIGFAHGIPLPGTGELRDLVSISRDDRLTFDNFLSKFQTLRLFYRSPDVIHRITREAIEDAASDNIRYLELQFTPVALSRAERFPLKDVMDWVLEAGQRASADFNIQTRFIASVNRHEDPNLAAQVVRLAVDRMDKGIVGLGLAGNEADFPGLNFKGVFKDAAEAGLRLTVHAGEWGGAPNVASAIKILGAERIGHGVRVVEDKNVVALARERGVAFEVCVTSNHQSGVITRLRDHPLPLMLHEGLNVTINTDDPSISMISLGNEYRVVCEDLGLTQQILRERVLAAAQASFLPEFEKTRLVEKIDAEYPTY